jgi:streptogramin lyase
VKFDVDDPEQASLSARSRGRARRLSLVHRRSGASTIGRFDPATQQFKEFTLPTPSSGPHGLQADKDGNIWYTGNAPG